MKLATILALVLLAGCAPKRPPRSNVPVPKGCTLVDPATNLCWEPTPPWAGELKGRKP